MHLIPPNVPGDETGFRAVWRREGVRVSHVAHENQFRVGSVSQGASAPGRKGGDSGHHHVHFRSYTARTSIPSHRGLEVNPICPAAEWAESSFILPPDAARTPRY